MEIKLYEIEDFFKKKSLFEFTTYISNKINTMGINHYIDMKKFYDGQGKDIPTNHYIYLLKEKSQIVGYHYFYLSPIKNFANLFATAVDTNYRERGYAKGMIEKSIEFVISRDIKNIEVPLTPSEETQVVMLKNYYLKSIKQKYDYIKWDIHVS